jgi:hypothetical protein
MMAGEGGTFTVTWSPNREVTGKEVKFQSTELIAQRRSCIMESVVSLNYSTLMSWKWIDNTMPVAWATPRFFPKGQRNEPMGGGTSEIVFARSHLSRLGKYLLFALVYAGRFCIYTSKFWHCSVHFLFFNLSLFPKTWGGGRHSASHPCLCRRRCSLGLQYNTSFLLSTEDTSV